jgi:hypothetical protein
MDYGINAATNVAKGSALGMQQGYAEQAKNAQAGNAPMTESEFVLDRLRSIRAKLGEVHHMSKVANDKIIGPAPDKIQPGETVKPSPITQGFLHTASQIIGEIDATASEIAEQLSRLHRSF